MYKEMLKEKLPYIIATALVVLALFILIFKLGTIIGFKRASFACQWGENYKNNFAGEKRDFFLPPPPMMMGKQPRPHGLFGTIIKYENSNLVIKDGNNEETVVLINNDTKIFNNDGTENQMQLSPESRVVVIGRPNNQGQVEAKIIRVESVGNVQQEIFSTSTNQN